MGQEGQSEERRKGQEGEAGEEQKVGEMSCGGRGGLKGFGVAGDEEDLEY